MIERDYYKRDEPQCPEEAKLLDALFLWRSFELNIDDPEIPESGKDYYRFKMMDLKNNIRARRRFINSPAHAIEDCPVHGRK